MSRPLPRISARALLLALLVALGGGALGAAAFARQNAHQTWRPDVTRTATGWRIVPPGARPPSNPVVGGDHVVWTWGADTLLFDLSTGKTRLIGAGGRATDVMPASISDRYVVWVQGLSPMEFTGDRVTYVYDTGSGRRYVLPADVQPQTVMVLAGDTGLWIAGRGATPEIRAYDLATGRQSVVATGDVSYPLFADGTLVAWYSKTPQISPQGGRIPSPLLVKDTANGTVTTVPPPAPGLPDTTAQTGWVAVRDGVLLGVGTIPGSHGSPVMVRDVAGGATRVMGTAKQGTIPAMDAGRVVWLESPAGDPGMTVVMGRRLDGSPAFEIARVRGLVDTVSLSGDTVAWLTRGNTAFWIETATLPR